MIKAFTMLESPWFWVLESIPSWLCQVLLELVLRAVGEQDFLYGDSVELYREIKKRSKTVSKRLGLKQTDRPLVMTVKS